MAIHIHLYGCNCIFCTSDFPLDFFQSQNGDGQTSQSATVPHEENDFPDEDSELEDDWDEEEDEDEEDGDDDESDEEDEPKPHNSHKKKLFGFLIGNHDICVL